MSGNRTDVLVIGGGPAGSTAAFQLASAGVEVTLIDRATFPREKVCGESLSPGALARLRAIGMWNPGDLEGGDPPAEAPSSQVVRGMRIRSPHGLTFSGRYRPGRGSEGLAIRRTILDQELLASARRRGVLVREGVEAVSAEPTASGGAMVITRSTGGLATHGIEARRVVIADGRRSFIARQMGFLEPPVGAGTDSGKRRFAVRAHCDRVSDLSDLAEMQVGNGGYCGIAPLSKTSANVCYVLFRNRMDMKPRTIAADFKRHLAGFPEVAGRLASAEIGEPIRVIGPLRLVSRRQSRGPFIACGDTGGFLDPFTGEGIAHAIASGVLGARAICDSLAGEAEAFRDYEARLRALRRYKGSAALLLYGLVSRPALANSAASLFARIPRLGDAVVRLFGDQI
jgi:flavin-dependent dehydrogenase